jgi:hypothetical protein
MPPTEFNLNTPKAATKSVSKWLWFILILVVIGGGAFWAMSILKTTETKPTNIAKQEKFEVTRTQVDQSKLPEKFPVDIPIETGAKVVDNYNASANNGSSQATRKFETAKTLDANFKLYSDFFSKNGWQTTNTVNQPELKAVFAAKDGVNAQVVIAKNSVTKKSTVEISVTYPKK